MLLYFLLHREDQLVLPVPSITTGIDRKQKGFPDGSVVKNLPASEGDLGSTLGQIDPWRKKWQSTPVFLPGKSHGQGSLVGYSPLGHKRVGYDLATKQQQK